MKTVKPHQIRIIAGKHRGRKIPVADRAGLRPSPNRVRETLYNWLQFEIAGGYVLDAFAGSGALGLEALSRGAASVLFCDKQGENVSDLRDILQTWKETHARVMQTDVLSLVPQTAYDLILLDPPFDQSLHQQCIDKFTHSAWLKPHGKIYLESHQPLSAYTLAQGFDWIKQAKAGQVHYGLIGRIDG